MEHQGAISKQSNCNITKSLQQHHKISTATCLKSPCRTELFLVKSATASMPLPRISGLPHAGAFTSRPRHQGEGSSPHSEEEAGGAPRHGLRVELLLHDLCCRRQSSRCWPRARRHRQRLPPPAEPTPPPTAGARLARIGESRRRKGQGAAEQEEEEEVSGRSRMGRTEMSGETAQGAAGGWSGAAGERKMMKWWAHESGLWRGMSSRGRPTLASRHWTSVR